MFRLTVSLLLFSCSLAAQAATWYAFTSANTESTRFFFDRDSVIKNGDKVTVWTKNVKDVKSINSDRRYSTAARRIYLCNKKAVQTLAFITYSKDGKILYSSSKPGDVTDIIPDSVDEEIIKAVCSHNFPRDKKSQLYYPVKDNDIFATTQNYFSDLEVVKVDAAPPQPTWYTFSNAYNRKTLSFFDIKSIDKDANGVTLWVLTVHDARSPSDGSPATGIRAYYSCSKKTAKYLVFSMYDKEGKFINSIPGMEDEILITDNSIDGKILIAVCSNDFPKTDGTGLYFSVKENDPYKHSRNFFEYLKDHPEEANAPK